MLEHIRVCKVRISSGRLVTPYFLTYSRSSTGIGPETWSFTSSDGSYTGQAGPSPDQTTFNSQHGFYITDGMYQMRPEVLESNFYAWRVTGDAKYYDRAVTTLQSLVNYLTVDGNSTMG